jgi:hypothetical protein
MAMATPTEREILALEREYWDVFGDVKFSAPDEHTALIAYSVKEELDVGDKPISLEAYDSSVWIRRGGNWVCAMHTEAVKGDPFGRSRGS